MLFYKMTVAVDSYKMYSLKMIIRHIILLYTVSNSSKFSFVGYKSTQVILKHPNGSIIFSCLSKHKMLRAENQLSARKTTPIRLTSGIQQTKRTWQNFCSDMFYDIFKFSWKKNRGILYIYILIYSCRINFLYYKICFLGFQKGNKRQYKTSGNFFSLEILE